MAIHHGYKINSTPGTAEPLMPARTLISWVSAWPRHVDDAAVVWPAHGVNPYDLNQIYMDVDEAEDWVQFVYHTT